MKQTDYAYSTAYIRALENKLLTKSDIEALVLSPDFQSAAQSLRDRGYTDRAITPENLDKILNEKLEESRTEAIWASPKDNILNIFIYKNDFHNLKAVLKCVVSKNKSFERFVLTPTNIDLNNLVEAIANSDFGMLPDYMQEAASEAFDALSRLGDGALADSVIDKACMDYMKAEADKTKNEFLIGLINLENTMADIKIAERSAKAGKDKGFLESALSAESDIDRKELILASVSDSVVDFLKEKGKEAAAKAIESGLGEFEKYADNAINDYVKTARFVTFGVEPVISYIQRKQAEIQAIRVILNAKHNKISEAEIRERLRDL